MIPSGSPWMPGQRPVVSLRQISAGGQRNPDGTRALTQGTGPMALVNLVGREVLYVAGHSFLLTHFGLL